MSPGTERSDERTTFLIAHVGEHDLRPFSVQLPAHHRAQSARRARDEGDPACNTSHRTPSHDLSP